jgi:hypothetical protein
MPAKLTKPVAVPEKLYECEVKRRRVRASGTGYEPFWKVKLVHEALIDGDTEFRCKDCHGALKLNKRVIVGGAGPHVAHKLKRDSEFCAGGWFFLEAKDGREARISCEPVR